jgi:hypothetical protein
MKRKVKKIVPKFGDGGTNGVSNIILKTNQQIQDQLEYFDKINTLKQRIKNAETFSSKAPYKAINDTTGALGAYQFIPRFNKDLVDSYPNLQDFMNNPQAQEGYMDKKIPEYFTTAFKLKEKYPDETKDLSPDDLVVLTHFKGSKGLERDIKQGNLTKSSSINPSDTSYLERTKGNYKKELGGQINNNMKQKNLKKLLKKSNNIPEDQTPKFDMGGSNIGASLDNNSNMEDMLKQLFTKNSGQFSASKTLGTVGSVFGALDSIQNNAQKNQELKNQQMFNQQQINPVIAPNDTKYGVQGYMQYGGVQQVTQPHQVFKDGGIAVNNDKILMGKGGEIHIKKSHEGRFTAYKKRTGKTTEEALHSKDPHVRQMANFAKNASHWKHAEGGSIDNTNNMLPPTTVVTHPGKPMVQEIPSYNNPNLAIPNTQNNMNTIPVDYFKSIHPDAITHFKNINQKFDNGGVVDREDATAEVEGGETAQFSDGTTTNFNGPKHSTNPNVDGGMPLNIQKTIPLNGQPPIKEANIYSDTSKINKHVYEAITGQAIKNNITYADAHKRFSNEKDQKVANNKKETPERIKAAQINMSNNNNYADLIFKAQELSKKPTINTIKQAVLDDQKVKYSNSDYNSTEAPIFDGGGSMFGNNTSSIETGNNIPNLKDLYNQFNITNNNANNTVTSPNNTDYSIKGTGMYSTPKDYNNNSSGDNYLGQTGGHDDSNSNSNNSYGSVGPVADNSEMGSVNNNANNQQKTAPWSLNQSDKFAIATNLRNMMGDKMRLPTHLQNKEYSDAIALMANSPKADFTVERNDAWKGYNMSDKSAESYGKFLEQNSKINEYEHNTNAQLDGQKLQGIANLLVSEGQSDNQNDSLYNNQVENLLDSKENKKAYYRTQMAKNLQDSKANYDNINLVNQMHPNEQYNNQTGEITFKAPDGQIIRMSIDEWKKHLQKASGVEVGNKEQAVKAKLGGIINVKGGKKFNKKSK